MQKKRNKLLEEVIDNSKILDLDVDTYSMAFHALNYDSMAKMELNPNDVHGAF